MEFTHLLHDLSHNLKALRQELGWSQAELARRSGVPKSTIGHIESGEIDPGFSAIARLAHALEITIEELASRPARLLRRIRSTDFPIVHQIKKVGRVLRMIPDPFAEVDLFWIEFEGRGVLPGLKPGLSGKRFIYCVSGKLTLQSADHDPIVLKTGEALVFSSQERHSYLNENMQSASALLVSRLGSQSLTDI